MRTKEGEETPLRPLVAKRSSASQELASTRSLAEFRHSLTGSRNRMSLTTLSVTADRSYRFAAMATWSGSERTDFPGGNDASCVRRKQLSPAGEGDKRAASGLSIDLTRKSCPAGIERDGEGGVPLRRRPFTQQGVGLFYALDLDRKSETYVDDHWMSKEIVFHGFSSVHATSLIENCAFRCSRSTVSSAPNFVSGSGGTDECALTSASSHAATASGANAGLSSQTPRCLSSVCSPKGSARPKP
jgi:hypothetical protein